MKEWAAFYKNLMGELNYQRSVSLGRPYLTSYDKDSVTRTGRRSCTGCEESAGSREDPAGLRI